MTNRRLGKLPYRADRRNLKCAQILQPGVELPPRWSIPQQAMWMLQHVFGTEAKA